MLCHRENDSKAELNVYTEASTRHSMHLFEIQLNVRHFSSHHQTASALHIDSLLIRPGPGEIESLFNERTCILF